MTLSIRKSNTKDGRKFDNHDVFVDGERVGCIGYPSIYVQSFYVFIAKDDNYLSLENREFKHPHNCIDPIGNIIESLRNNH